MCTIYHAGRHITVIDGLCWIYPGSNKTMEMADLLPLEECIKKRNDTMSVFVEESRELIKECRIASKLTREN